MILCNEHETRDWNAAGRKHHFRALSKVMGKLGKKTSSKKTVTRSLQEKGLLGCPFNTD